MDGVLHTEECVNTALPSCRKRTSMLLHMPNQAWLIVHILFRMPFAAICILVWSLEVLDMAATFSSALILLIYLYLYHIYDDAIHFPTDSDAFSFSNIGYTTLLGKGNRASTPLLVSNGLAPAKVILSRSGFSRTRDALTRWMKHGLTI